MIQFVKNSKELIKIKRNTKEWIQTAIQKEKRKEGKILFVFCSDDYLLNLNKEFLNHHTLTDIITFDYSEGKTISGEIYISTERVTENAEKFGVSFQHELYRVIIHGILHLCGYSDKSDSAQKKMRSRENYWLSYFNQNYGLL